MGVARPVRVVRFSSFQLDLRAGELRRNGIRLRVPEQSLRVLATLVENPGQVVTREELRQKLWPNGTIVMFDRSINAAIKRLREALEDSAEHPKFIETLPRRGYRFLVAVEQAESFEAAVPSDHKHGRDDLLGKRISHYRMVRRLGQGAMGVVYEAEDTRSGRTVALKFLPEELSSDARALERFEREAQAASALNHPNICSIHEFAEVDGVQFIVMEYVPGKSLDQLIASGRLPLNYVLSYAIQIADALCEAHSAGIVHRDLKPSNVIVRPDGVLKLLDFGVAKVRAGQPPFDLIAPQTDPVLTLEGTILGTLQYMAPEQLEAKATDSRTDIFALGALMYEMATGRKAFEGASQASLIAAILERQPAPASAIQPGIPAALANVIETCLAKQPQARWQTAHEVLLQLNRIVEEGPAAGALQAAKASSSGRIVRRLVTAGAVLAITVTIVGGLRFFRSRLAPGEPPLVAVPLTSEVGVAGHPSFSPDGSRVVYFRLNAPAASCDECVGVTTSLYIKKIGDPDPPRRLSTAPGYLSSPAWSPDGRSVAFLRTGAKGKTTVLLVPSTDGPEQPLATISIPSSEGPPELSWLPDGRSLVTVDRSSPSDPWGLIVLSVDTGAKHKLTSPPKGAGSDEGPAVSPDGRWVAFSRGGNVSHLYLLELTEDHTPKGEPQQITFAKEITNSPAWAADGRSIVFSSGPEDNSSLYRIAVLRGRAGALERLPGAGEGAYYPAVSRSGNHLIFSRAVGGGFEIWQIQSSALGKVVGPVNLISSTKTDEDPQYSPDGSRIAFKSTRSGRFEIWICESDGSNPRQLTTTVGPSTWFPHWSPDGRKILFNSNPEGRDEMFVIDSRGGTPQRFASGPAHDPGGFFSRDGRWIYFVSDRTGQRQIWRIPALSDGGHGNAVQVTRSGAAYAIESPDGKYLYCLKEGHTPRPLVRIPVEGGDETPVLPSIFYLNFAVAEEGIYFVPGPVQNRFSIQFLSFSSGKISNLARIGDPGWVLAVSPGPKTHTRSILYNQHRRQDWNLMLVDNFR